MTGSPNRIPGLGMPDTPRTLLLIAPFPPTKGPEADKAYHLCQALAEHGWHVHVVTTTGSVACDHPQAVVHPVMRDWSWSDAPLVMNLLEQTGPDLVLLLFIDWLYNYHPMATFLPSLFHARCPGVEVVTVFDDVSVAYPWRQSFPVRLGRQQMRHWVGMVDTDDRYGTLLRDSNRVVVVSTRVALWLERYQPDVATRLTIVPTPPIVRMASYREDLVQQCRSRLGLAGGEFLLAYFGYLSQGKGIETLLRAFAHLSQTRRDLHLVLIGGTVHEAEHQHYAREVRGLMEPLGITGRLSWTGEFAWDSTEASELLHAADLCVLPYDSGVCSHNCSFVGAAAHGLPIITTRGADLEEMFRDGENVLLVPPESPDALAEAIQTLVNDPVLRQRLSLGAARLAAEHFTWEVALTRMGLLPET